MSSMTSPKRRSRFALLALVGLTLGTIFMAAPPASAQIGIGFGGGFYNRGYGGFNRGFGGFNRGFGGFNRGYGYGGGFGNGFYNRGYGGYGNGFYNRGYGGYGNGFGVPLINPPIYGPAAYGGFY